MINKLEKVAIYSDISSYSLWLGKTRLGEYRVVKEIRYSKEDKAYIVLDLDNNVVWKDAVYHSDNKRKIKRFGFNRKVKIWAEAFSTPVDEQDDDNIYDPASHDLVLTNRNVHDRVIATNRPSRNDCWNVALAIGTGEKYETIRQALAEKRARSGAMRDIYITRFAKKYNYKEVDFMSRDYYQLVGLTLNQFANETEHTNYEYLAYTRGHVVYIRGGKIYDSFNSIRRKVTNFLKREIR